MGEVTEAMGQRARLCTLYRRFCTLSGREQDARDHRPRDSSWSSHVRWGNGEGVRARVIHQCVVGAIVLVIV